MSYVLQLWESGQAFRKPEDLAAAVRQMEAAWAGNGGQNPLFRNLAETLTGRFPCICSPAEEGLPEGELAWSDGTLDGRTASAVYGIGLPLACLDETLPFVVETARGLGLNVMAPLAGTVYLADGATLGSPRSTANAESEIPSPQDLAKGLMEVMTRTLVPLGLTLKKREKEHWRFFPGAARWWTWRLARTITRTGRAMARSPSVSSRAQVPAVLRQIEAELATDLVPLLETCTTLEGFDKLKNTEPPSERTFCHGSHNIMAGYLAGNPRLEDLCRAYEAAMQPVPLSKTGKETRKVIDLVRAHPRGSMH